MNVDGMVAAALAAVAVMLVVKAVTDVWGLVLQIRQARLNLAEVQKEARREALGLFTRAAKAVMEERTKEDKPTRRMAPQVYQVAGEVLEAAGERVLKKLAVAPTGRKVT